MRRGARSTVASRSGQRDQMQCWVQTGERCVFHTVGEDQSGAELHSDFLPPEPIPTDGPSPGAAAAATAAVAPAESANATADVMQQHNQRKSEDEAARKKAVERAIRVCKKCGVYECWQDLTDECCWVQTGEGTVRLSHRG